MTTQQALREDYSQLNSIFDELSLNYDFKGVNSMIKRFSAENFHSFRDRVEVKLATTGKVASPGRYQHIGDFSVSLLSAVLGANGSGKTSVLRIPAFISWFISTSQELPNDEVPLQINPHFALRDSTSKFELDFDVDGNSYFYKLELTEERVVRESLYKKKTRLSRIFERNWNSKTQNYDIQGPNFGVSKLLEVNIRRNASLIGFDAFANSEEAKKIQLYFKNSIYSNITIVGKTPSVLNLDSAVNYFGTNPKYSDIATEWIRSWDFGISDLNFEHHEIPLQNSTVVGQWIVTGIHKTKNATYKLPFGLESDGTKTALYLLRFLIPALEEGGVVLWDEIESELHPYILKEILGMFTNPAINKKKAQLILSTHSTVVMEMLDKNQIFLAEKDSNLHSHVFALSDIQGIRADENFEAKYLLGAYGAVPEVQ